MIRPLKNHIFHPLPKYVKTFGFTDIKPGLVLKEGYIGFCSHLNLIK